MEPTLSGIISTLIYSFTLGLSLILAIGAQNAFVLKQGLKGEHVFWVCAVCALSDALLIGFGVYGFKLINELLPVFADWARYGGAAFLFVYGIKSFLAAYNTDHSLKPEGEDSKSLWSAVAVCLAFTWLNPHVYLDTVVLIGSISTGFQSTIDYFAAGAVIASFVFFFSLGYGAALLRPVFARPVSWKILDGLIGTVMWLIALSLLFR